MTKKAGKAHKNAKAARAAKHRAKKHHHTELRRAQQAERRAAQHAADTPVSPAPSPPPALVSQRANAAFEFCKRHDMSPYAVLDLLMREQPAPWVLKAGAATHEIDADTRQELRARLSRTTWRYAEKRQPAEVQLVSGTPQDCE
jgi:hypothetical protein